MADEWMIVSTSGEYSVTGDSCLHAIATFMTEHPDDPIHAICVQGSFKDGFRWQLKYHETDWRCPECGYENGHADTCQRGGGGGWGMRIRQHHGFGHGLAPGTDHDINCPSCKREKAEGVVPVIHLVTEEDHDAAMGGPELRAAEKFEQDNPHD